MLDKTTPGKFPADALVDRLGLPQAQIIAEITPSLHQLDDAALIEFRRLVDDVIEDRAHERRRQLAAIAAARGTKPARSRPSLRGVKIAPKYRGPNGETWAGRGARPKWLDALLAHGRSLDEFRIASGGDDVA